MTALDDQAYAYPRFLVARWNEEEKVAQFKHANWCALVAPVTGTECDCGHPAYLLAALAAQRVILEAYEEAHESEVRNPFTSGSVFTLALHEALVALAEPFRSHPNHPANAENPFSREP